MPKTAKPRVASHRAIGSQAAPPLPDAPWCQSLRRRLTGWYRRHHRRLPWRDSRDPYRVWISEVMLQQTQVATVVPYFERFVASFPDVAALAQAPEQEVLRHWEGLGYYRRARQLHKAAKQVVDRHDGVFPDQLERVRELAGVGRYTAGAVVSIAFDRPAPILEANTRRLYCRLWGFGGDPSGRDGEQALWEFATRLLPRRGSGELNQALMELGSQICTPRAPRCDECPLADLCAARRLGLQAELPRQRKKPATTAVREAAVVVWRGRQVLVRQHSAVERWAGLWDFLRFPLDDAEDQSLQAQLADGVAGLSGLQAPQCEHFATIKHGVTRFRITLDCFHARAASGRLRTADAPLAWVSVARLAELPLSKTARQIAELLTDQPAGSAQKPAAKKSTGKNATGKRVQR